MLGLTPLGLYAALATVDATGAAYTNGSATGDAELWKFAAGELSSEATATGGARRDVVSVGSMVGAASGGAAGVRTRRVSGDAVTRASAEANPTRRLAGDAAVHASASAGAEAARLANTAATGGGHSTAHAYVLRRFRVRFQPPAVAHGSAFGEGWTFVAADGRAVGYARAVGTTFHVGQGTANATASLGSSPERITTPSAACTFYSTATGRGAVFATADATPSGHAAGGADAAIRVEGTLHFEVFGSAQATGSATSTHVAVYQPLWARAAAWGAATATYTYAARGVVFNQALATADCEVRQTGAGTVAIGVQATACGGAWYVLVGAGAAATESLSTGDALRRTTRVESHAWGSAAIEADSVRTHHGLGGAETLVLAGADSVRIHHGIGSAETSALVGAGSVRTRRPGGWARCAVSSTAFCARTTRGGGAALPDARAVGFNQINDLTFAPNTRTVFVLAVDRGFVLNPQTRHMAA